LLNLTIDCLTDLLFRSSLQKFLINSNYCCFTHWL